MTQHRSRWHAACAEMLDNVWHHDFAPHGDGAVRVLRDGISVPLPAYIPYVGPAYFAFRPRLLCYAINQNLSRHAPWTEEWLDSWSRDFNTAHNRLNLAVQAGDAMPIRPYAEGFVPLVAMMALKRWAARHGGQLPDKVDNVISVTNFVKFSTAEDASSASIPLSWWRECAERYVKHEISVLKPDVLLAFGKTTARELKRVIAGAHLHQEPDLLECRFPARIPSVKSRPLSRAEQRAWDSEIAPLIGRIRKPRPEAYRQWKMGQFPGYFLDVAAYWDRG